MYGWWGRILRIDVSKRKYVVQELDPSIYSNYIGGRGLAAKILWDELVPGVDPLSPHNKLVIASGPLSGLPLPSSGKLVVASKSPLTNGYGDGNIGTMASVHLRKAGYDAIVLEGASDKPIYLYIENDKVEFMDADDLWGRDAFDAEDKLVREHGRNIGVLLIGPAGENLVRYATIVSMKGRSGGRPGMGAVMGFKKVKAIVIKGTRNPPIADEKKLRELSEASYKEVLSKENYDFWIRQGTMATIVWSNENSVLPTMNFREGVWEYYDTISGDLMEKLKIERRGCPYCNMQCGNVIIDETGEKSELDYENVAMLGSNILLPDLRKVAELNKLADMYGLDTISLGNSLGFTMEASEKRLIREKIEWGDYGEVKELVKDIAYRRGLGAFLAEGVWRMSLSLGREAQDFAMHAKGLEVSAYNCHAAPGMALAFATSPIGAHHKDAWLIGLEVKMDRFAYNREKVEKLIFLQRVRGGMFESLTTCRLPWVELGLNLDYYPKMLSAATGIEWSMDDIYRVADRIYTLIRAFWIREYNRWSRTMDYPPMRWFKHPLTKGPFAGVKLDINKYDKMLSIYYEMRGWDERGVPKKETLEKLGLKEAIPVLDSIVGLK
ncbi:aldehyde ferredoxin oxidoreductase family protein [Staphylothermus hellenicus]|uniref:Aldehyde ferredoxin oxidoreductase n=1 Tax=Staphylothermus hellenicus (strain DSM 12710 / JCM 10830 / BK20S6-10-b1 / P8) TaxID=591019 RepID=D7D9B8_STAHD|nr:aldehyde ferredoxin oxidoreductase family protein [Staphylothermus hellenicus]ADI32364.1 Aldehyde ferredoxin oxidoreductase [Staphylothermus hellenicus DSM 12710]